VPSRRVLLAVGLPALVVFLVVSFGLARWLSVESQERSAIAALLRSEARGDAADVADRLDACAPGCRSHVRDIVQRVRKTPGDGPVRIVRLDSGTAHSFGSRRAWSRVVWVRGEDGEPLVQCVQVRRHGDPVTGRSVSLLRLTAPLADNEDPC
jgi:hypothetical protein